MHRQRRACRTWVARNPVLVEAFLQTVRLTGLLQSKRLRWPDTPIDTLIREAKQLRAHRNQQPAVAPCACATEVYFRREGVHIPKTSLYRFTRMKSLTVKEGVKRR